MRNKPKTLSQIIRGSRRERFLTWLDYSTRTVRHRCRECRLKRPDHKFGCSRREGRGLRISVHAPDGYFDR